jgi:hypothetical protein
MSMRPRATWRTRAVIRWLVLAAAGLLMASCGGPSASAPGGTTAAGFPLGSFEKRVDDPMVGPTRMIWTFTPDGRYTEIQLALDGQRVDAVPILGTFTADGDSVTIATSYPPGMGTSTHGWRRDGDQLWTFLIESDNPDDKDWFETIDSRPWTPYRS